MKRFTLITLIPQPGQSAPHCKLLVIKTLVNAFSRYESGKTKPPVALVKLLKVLDRHPDLLEEIKAA